ncbi:LysR substrate-binding domain-containing protein [Salinispira pacifica]|uniref:Hydrogen peroxide-inducible genes activator n=1 Tax=Salinispira pacifica TaxID=1307761 RepID=V5WNR5_9SPIO|nr:LysR substrate-binding domain-containing protein [Salinispira pacifica]AHC16711.1 Hydrogen peroxide-inducible genes activator [Salinispira pacifica]
MNIRDIEYFQAVAQLGQFRAAALRCNVSQPTLSGQIKKLEEELGHPLFERHTRSVLLTDFGSEALQVAEKILRGVQELEQKANAARDPYSGTLRVGIFPTLGPWLFPRIARKISETYPDLEIYLLEEQSAELQAKLANGELDCAFLALPQEEAQNCVVPIFRESFVVAVPSRHPWGQREEIAVKDLDGQEMLLLSDGHCFRDQALDLCLRYGAREREKYRATGIETLRQMVRMGTGITLIPQLAVPSKPEEGISYIPVADADFGRDIALLYRRTHPRLNLLNELAELISSYCLGSMSLRPLENGCIE